jgi:hypothetical protein
VKKGICKLCLLPADLCDSHYIPRAMYKYNRAPELKTPHPVMLTSGKPKQGTEQVRDYVLCKACENRFRQNGETWVLAHIPHDYGEAFPLHAAVKAITPVIFEPDTVLIAGKATAGFDMEKLIYFGASIFWRGAAHQWAPIDGYEVPVVHLGPYQEQLRLFLVGQNSFPANVSLTIMLWPFEKVPPAALMPDLSHQTAGWNQYWFYITGLGFVLDFGKSVPAEVRSRSSSHSAEGLVTISKPFGDMVWKQMKKLATDFSSLEQMLKEIEIVRSKGPQTT